MIPQSHQGAWKGPNRLWLEKPEPETSEGTLMADTSTLRYTWLFGGQSREGELTLFGPAGAVRAAWKDTFHAASGMALHGRFDSGVLSLYGTYGAGDGPEWGWHIEVDVRDPQHLQLRMFNIDPSDNITMAVDLRGGRYGS
jgi:hypothetical protein